MDRRRRTQLREKIPLNLLGARARQDADQRASLAALGFSNALLFQETVEQAQPTLGILMAE